MHAHDDAGEGETRSVWRYARASRAHVVVDAAAYFELMQDAFLQARQRIFLIGWDFDSRIRLARGRRTAPGAARWGEGARDEPQARG